MTGLDNLNQIADDAQLQSDMFMKVRVSFAIDVEKNLQLGGFTERVITMDRGEYRIALVADGIEVFSKHCVDRAGLDNGLISSDMDLDCITKAVSICAKSNPDKIRYILRTVYLNRMNELNMHDPSSVEIYELAVETYFSHLMDIITNSFESFWD
jgi:hypothetical protein